MKKLLSVVLMVAAVGCEGGSGTVPVEGVVKLDGQPLKEVSIQFVPQGTGRDATATTDANGKFVMGTFKAKDGVVPGSYKVVVTQLGPIDATVVGGGSAEEAMGALSADAPKPKPKPTGPQVPEAYTRADRTPLKQDIPAKGEIVFDIKSK